MSEFGYLCQSVVAVTFLMSAAWKLRNRTSFEAVVAGGADRLRNFRGPVLGLLIASLEITIGGGLIVYSGYWFPGAAAAAFLILFSVFLARADSLANGCGCWRPPQLGRDNASPYLARNTLLIALAAIGASGGSALGAGPKVALTAVSILPAFLVMEIPTVVSLIRPAKPSLTMNTDMEP